MSPTEPGVPIPLHRVAPVQECVCPKLSELEGAELPWTLRGPSVPAPQGCLAGAFTLVPAAFWAGSLCLQRSEGSGLHFPGAPAADVLMQIRYRKQSAFSNHTPASAGGRGVGRRGSWHVAAGVTVVHRWLRRCRNGRFWKSLLPGPAS